MRVAFLRSWNHWPAGDAPHGTNTHYRAGRSYELPDDVARAAIAAGRAEAVAIEPAPVAEPSEATGREDWDA